MTLKNNPKKFHFDKKSDQKVSQNLKKKESISVLISNRRKRLLLKVVVFFTLFFILLLSVIVLFRLDRLNIKLIKVKGNSTVNTDEIIDSIKKDIVGNYFFILPKSNIFVYPNEKIEKNIIDNFKWVENVSVSINNINAISVKIEERRPYAVWCVDDDTSCYFIDKKGYIFDRAVNFSDTQLRFYGGNINIDNPIGNTYLSENDFFKKIFVFIESMRSIGLNSHRFITKDYDSCEIYLEDGKKIIINKKQDLEEAFENLKSVTESKDFDSNFEYIDIRFGNKIFYK